MELGIFSNSRRPERDIATAWDLDIDEMIVADRLGFKEAWVSEHECNADLIVMRGIQATESIRIGSAVRCLPYYHPVQIAIDARACDQLSRGRYMLGVGPGYRKDKVAWRGGDAEHIRAMTDESIDVILQLLERQHGAERFAFAGRFWSGSQILMELPLRQRPRMPVATSILNSTESAEAAGRRGIMILTADFTSAKKLKALGDALEKGQEEAGRQRRRQDLRVCRVIYIGETDTQARDDMRDTYAAMLKWEIVNTPQHHFDRIPPGGSLEDITFDYLVDSGSLMVGSAETVRQMIEELWSQVGGFGLLLQHAGRDYATPEKVATSMRKLAEEVAPRVTAGAPLAGSYGLEALGAPVAHRAP